MKINIINMLSVLFAILVFGSLNVPSIKIFYSSEIVNIVLVVGIWLVGALKISLAKQTKISKTKLIFLVLFTLLWLFMLLNSLLQTGSILSPYDFAQYLGVMAFVIGITVFIEKKELPTIIKLQVVWAFLLSVTHATVGIELDRSLGQHYLTLGVPIAAGLVSAFGLLFYKKTSLFKRLILLFVLAVLVLGVTSLSGRSPFLLSIITPLIVVGLGFLLESSLSKKIKTVFTVLIITPLAYFFVYRNLSDGLVNRLERLFSLEEETRSNIYSKSLNLIQQNPFGYGLGTIPSFDFVYPHNIFLEIMLSGGILVLLVFLFLLFFIFKRLLLSVKQKSYGICVALLFVYFFLTWNLSFDLTSSYIPFTSMVLVISATEMKKTWWRR